MKTIKMAVECVALFIAQYKPTALSLLKILHIIELCISLSYVFLFVHRLWVFQSQSQIYLHQIESVSYTQIYHDSQQALLLV